MINYFKNFLKKTKCKTNSYLTFIDNKFLCKTTEEDFKQLSSRVCAFSTQIFKYMENNGIPQDSYKLVIDNIKKKCTVEINNKYIDPGIFLNLFDTCYGIKNKALYTYNIFTGLFYLCYHFPELLHFYFKQKEKNDSYKGDKNITLRRKYNITNSTNIKDNRNLVLFTLLNNIKLALKLDKLVIGIPVSFEHNGHKNTSIGVFIFDDNTNIQILENKLKSVKTMAIATDLINSFVKHFNTITAMMNLSIQINIDTVNIREKIDIISTMFYYDGEAKNETNFDFTFLPTKNVIEKLNISSYVVKNNNILELNTNITTCYTDYSDKLNKNGDYSIIPEEY